MPAAPIIGFFAAIGGAIGSVAGAIGLHGVAAFIAAGHAASVGFYAVTAVANVAMSALIKKPKLMNSSASGGSPIDFKADPNAGVPLVLGRTGTSGTIVHALTGGTNNEVISYLTVLSVGPVQNIESLWVENKSVLAPVPERVALPVPGFASGGQNFMGVSAQYGHTPEPYQLVSSAINYASQGWGAPQVLSGLAAAWWECRYQKDVFKNGIPKPMWFVVNGPPVYDPRLDSTVPGGSGACRWNNESTWVHTGKANPYLQALSYIAGRRQNGKLTHGLGAPQSAVDMPAYIFGANVAQANNWENLGGVILSTDDRWNTLQAMLQVGGGMPTRLGGLISCFVQAPRVSLKTITRDDIIGECTIVATKVRKQRINTMVPRYRSEVQSWTIIPGTTVQIPAYVQADGGERMREVEFPLLQRAGQAAQLAAYMIGDSREFEPVTIPLKPYLQGLQPGDCVTVNEPELGLNGQKLIIWGRQFDAQSGTATFTMRSETDAKHPFALGLTDSPPGTAGLTGWDGDITPPDPAIWTALGTTVVGSASSLPAIEITGHRDNPHADTLVIQTRVAGAGGNPSGAPWVFAGSSAIVDDLPMIIDITAGINALTSYQVRISYMSSLGTQSTWTLLPYVSAGDFSFNVLNGIISDGWLTPAEKTTNFIPLITALQGARAQLRVQAAGYGLTIQNSSLLAFYETSQANLDAYLATLTTPVAWNDTSGQTQIANPATFRVVLHDAFQSQTDLQSAMSGAALGILNQLAANVGNLASDGDLSPSDKTAIVPALQAAIGQRAILRAQANSYGLTAQTSVARADFETWAVADADNVLNSLTTPVRWDDMTGHTTLPIPSDFRRAVYDIYNGTMNLERAIADAARTEIVKLASDGDLSPSDKLSFNPHVQGFIDRRAATRSRAAQLGMTTQAYTIYAYYENAQAALDNVLQSLTSPVPWYDHNGHTTVPYPPTLTGAVTDASSYEAGMIAKMDQLFASDYNYWKTQVGQAGTQLGDGILTPTEKMTFIPFIKGMIGARANLRSQANLNGLTGAQPTSIRAVFESACSDVDNHLANSTAPVQWYDSSGNTNVFDPVGFRAAIENEFVWASNLSVRIDERRNELLSPWATYQANAPGVFEGRTQWLDNTGKAFDYRALPINAPSGNAAGRTFWPLSSDTSAVYIQAYAEYRTNGILYLPAGAVGGLPSDYEFCVFWAQIYGQYVAYIPAQSPPYFAEPYNYLYVGTQKTAVQPNVYNPPVVAPPGALGGGASLPGDMSYNWY